MKKQKAFSICPSLASAAFAAVIVLSTRGVWSGQPVRFNYQATLTAQGMPMQGVHTLYASIWDGGTTDTAGSGTKLYGEVATPNIVNGLLSHVIGTGDYSGFGAALDETLFATDGDVYLQVAIDSPSNVILPRSRLESVPYAVRALSADRAISSGVADNGVPSGSIIMGTSPAAPSGFTATGGTVFTNWTPCTSMLLAVHLHGVASANNKVYVIGGYNGSTAEPNNQQYDPSTNLWTAKLPLVTPRYGLTCTEVGGLIYAIGGISSGAFTGATEVYDPNGNTWTTGKAAMHVPRGAHAAALANGLIYTFGGGFSGSSTTNTVEKYDPVTNIWTIVAPMPTARLWAGAANVNGKIYVVGGSPSSSSINYIAANEEYDPVSNTWATRAPLPAGAYGVGVASFGGKLYAFGGVINPAVATINAWVYDPGVDSWSPVVPLSTPQYFLGATVAASRIFAIGGQELTPTATVIDSARAEKLDPNTYYVYSKD